MFLHPASSARSSCRQGFSKLRHSSYLKLEIKQHLLLALWPPIPQHQASPLIPAQRINVHSKQWAQKWLLHRKQTIGMPCPGKDLKGSKDFFMNRNFTCSLRAPVKQEETQQHKHLNLQRVFRRCGWSKSTVGFCCLLKHQKHAHTQRQLLFQELKSNYVSLESEVRNECSSNPKNDVDFIGMSLAWNWNMNIHIGMGSGKKAVTSAPATQVVLVFYPWE